MKLDIESKVSVVAKNQKEHEDAKLIIQQNIQDYEELLKKIGFSRVQWLVFIKSGLILLMAMNELIGIGIIAIASKCDFELNSGQKGILTGSSLLGNILSSYFWGYLSDTKGRRPVLFASILTANFFTIISIFVPNFWMFVALRFCVGLSISGATNVSYAYLGEFFTAYYRPVAINYASLFVALSVIYMPGIAWLILEMGWSFEITEHFLFRPWRLLSIFYTVPGLIAALMLWFLPESPKILFSLGRVDEAYESIKWICKKSSREDLFHAIRINKQKSNTFDQAAETERVNIFRKMWQETYPLFQRPFVFNFLICCCAMCSIFMSSIGMGIWFPDIQNRLRSNINNANQSVRVCDVIENRIHERYLNVTMDLNTKALCDDTISEKTYIDYMSYGVLCSIGYLVLGSIINLFGRKVIYISFLVISGVFGLALLYISDPQGILWSFAIFLVLPELCMSMTNGIVVDLVPTHLCGQAVCICLLLGRLSSALATSIIGLLLESHCLATFSFFSIFLIICGSLALFLPTARNSK